MPEPISDLTSEALNTTALRFSWQNPFASVYHSLQLNLTAADGAVMTFDLPFPPATVTHVVGGLDPGKEYTATVVVRSKVADSATASSTLRTSECLVYFPGS